MIKESGRVTTEQHQATRTKALELMHAMMLAAEPVLFDTAYDQFEAWVRQIHASHQYDAADLLVYFNREYMPKKESWSRAWRRVRFLFF